MIDFNSMVPLYQQVIEQIMIDIEHNKFDKTRRLPTEDEMSRNYGVSRITIRKAVSELANRGIVVKKQGKGTFLKTPPMKKVLNNSAMSFTNLCHANGKVAGSKELEASICIPEDTDVIEALGLQEGEKAVRIRRLRYADGKPLVIEDNYFPLKYSYLIGIDLENKSLYSYLETEQGINIISGHLTMRLIRANNNTAHLLNVQRNTPMLQLWSTNLCENGEILHTCRQVGYGEDFDFIIR